MVESVPPDKGCEVLDEELTHEEWDENDSESFADSDDSHSLLKLGEGVHYDMLWGVKNFRQCNMTLPYNSAQKSNEIRVSSPRGIRYFDLNDSWLSHFVSFHAFLLQMFILVERVSLSSWDVFVITVQMKKISYAYYTHKNVFSA